MTTPTYERALVRLLEREGTGIADDKRDRGGRTKWGVTQKTYDAWRTTTGQHPRPVDDMTEVEMRTIYFEDYWRPCACELMPEPIADCVFDMAVHSGVWNACITLQDALRVRQDGKVGPITLAAARPPGVVVRFLKKRGDFIQQDIQAHPSDVVFLENWIGRLLDLAALWGRA